MAIVEGFPSVSGVVDAVELSKDLAGLIIRDTSGNPRVGVFPRHVSALVTSRANMQVDVAAFEGVCVRNGGIILMANDGTTQVTIAAAPVSNSRIDVVYFKQNKSSAPDSDANNTALLDVVTGTAAASPVKPSIPAGATELATVLVPAGVSATNAGGVVITQTFQYTTTTGGTILCRTLSDFPAAATYVEGTKARDIATDSEYVNSGSAWLALPGMPSLQVDTTNSTPLMKRKVGRGKITAVVAQSISEAVTFDNAFSGVPVVVSAYIGRRNPSGAYNDVALDGTFLGIFPQALVPTTTGFTMLLGLISGNFGAGVDYYYSWIAEGPA